MGKSMNATQLEPRLKYFRLRPTASIQDKIPRYPASELMNSFETKSAIKKMINSATAGARALAQNDELNAKMRTQSIDQELYDRMAAVRMSAISSAEKREMDAAADIARQVEVDRATRAAIRAMPPPPAAPFMEPPFGTDAPFLAESLRTEPPCAHPESIRAGRGSALSSIAPSRDEFYDTRSRDEPTEASAYDSGLSAHPDEIDVVMRGTQGEYPVAQKSHKNLANILKANAKSSVKCSRRMIFPKASDSSVLKTPRPIWCSRDGFLTLITA